MENLERKPLILALLALTTLVFVIGTILFFKSDYENKALKSALETQGIRTKGYVLGKSLERKRSLSSSDLKIEQLFSSHFIRFWYDHSMQAQKDRFSLENYLPDSTESTSVNTDTKNLGKIEAQVVVEEELYDALNLGSSIDVIYLAKDPASVRLLNSKGEVDVPMLSIFSYITLILACLSAYLVFYYYKTGRTF